MGMIKALPFPFSSRTGSASETYELAGIAYHVALGGMPWLLAINDQRPMTHAGAPVRKEQVDDQQIPGEQSLANWWLRSQSTFIGGAGLLYQDPSVDNQFAIRYAESTGLNPWENGKITLLRSTSQDIADATSDVHHLVGYNDGTDRYWSAVGNILKSSDGSTATTITWGGANDIVSLTSDGTNYYAADSVGIYSAAGTTAGTKAWDTGSTATVIAWVKGRLMAGIDNAVYELVGGSPPTLPTAKFSHLNTSWTWTAFSEGPTAIYAAGHAGSQSAIYKFELATDGAVPTLADGGVITAQLPLGEVVHCMYAYLGSFVGIGTSRGFRVGQITDAGDIVYGPLLFEIDDGVKSVAGFDRFLFVGASNAIGSNSGLYRVDLGQQVGGDGPAGSVRFAYATDLQAGVSGEVTAVTNFGNSDRMVFAVVGNGSYLESADVLESSGELLTGRIRYNTLEPKIYKFVSVKSPTGQSGSISIDVLDPGGGDTSVITVTDSSVAIQDVVLESPGEAAEWIQLRFTLGRDDSDTTTGAEIHGWQLKAMPGAVRQHLLTVPLLLQDREKDRSGQIVGYEGRSQVRLSEFKNLFAAGDTLTYQDLVNGSSCLVVIDDYSYEQTSPPGNNKSTHGGVLWVQLRTVADVVSS